MRLLGVALAVLLAGCLGTPQADDEAATRAQVQGSESPVPPLGPQAPRFVWSSADVRGDAGLLLRVHIPEEDHCLLSGGLARATGRSSVTSVFALQGPDLDTWSVTGQTSSSHVHLAGLVDTREESGAGADLEARLTSVDVPRARGDVVLLLLGRDLEPWPSSLLEGASMHVAVSCSRPFDVSAAEVTRDFLLVDSHTLTGGAGAHVQPGASVSLLDEASATAQGDHGFLLWGSVGGAGLLTLDHPAGTERWLVQTGQTQTFTGNPGRYRATLDRAGADFDYFFAALAGMHDVVSLDEIAALPAP